MGKHVVRSYVLVPMCLHNVNEAFRQVCYEHTKQNTTSEKSFVKIQL